MAISLKTHKRLWGRSASRCAVCQKELVEDASETDEESIIGEACHIIAKSPDGPRGSADLEPEKRDKYANLILLCSIHHKQVDDQPNTFTVEKLRQIKASHEESVREKFCFDPDKQEDDQRYADYVDQWEKRINIAAWENWTSYVCYGDQPSLSDEMKTALEEVHKWLLTRIWPRRYPNLESAFNNFRLVANDFCMVFSEHAEKHEDGFWRTRKFYQIDEWNQKRYNRLARKYDCHVALVEDLMLELTRAANYVCDAVRRDLMKSYRIDEGALLVWSGPRNFTYKFHLVEYQGDERNETPYPGLKMYKSLRFKRDLYFGSQDECSENPISHG